MAGRKNMGYKTRYTFQVTAEQDKVFQRELKFQREEEAAGTRCTDQGPLIARLLTEACQARGEGRGWKPADESDPAPEPDGKPTVTCPNCRTVSIDGSVPGADLTCTNCGHSLTKREFLLATDTSPGGDGGGPGMPAAIPG